MRKILQEAPVLGKTDTLKLFLADKFIPYMERFRNQYVEFETAPALSGVAQTSSFQVETIVRAMLGLNEDNKSSWNARLLAALDGYYCVVNELNALWVAWTADLYSMDEPAPDHRVVEICQRNPRVAFDMLTRRLTSELRAKICIVIRCR